MSTIHTKNVSSSESSILNANTPYIRSAHSFIGEQSFVLATMSWQLKVSRLPAQQDLDILTDKSKAQSLTNQITPTQQ